MASVGVHTMNFLEYDVSTCITYTSAAYDKYNKYITEFKYLGRVE